MMLAKHNPPNPIAYSNKFEFLPSAGHHCVHFLTLKHSMTGFTFNELLAAPWNSLALY